MGAAIQAKGKGSKNILLRKSIQNGIILEAKVCYQHLLALGR
jgi:hypothetical protein